MTQPAVRQHIREVAAHFQLDEHIKPVDLTLHPGVPDAWGFVDTSVEPPVYVIVMESKDRMLFGAELSQAQRLSKSLGATAFLEAGRFVNPAYYVDGPMSEYVMLAKTDDPRMHDVERNFGDFSGAEEQDLKALIPADVAEQGHVVSGLANRIFAKREE